MLEAQQARHRACPSIEGEATIRGSADLKRNKAPSCRSKSRTGCMHILREIWARASSSQLQSIEWNYKDESATSSRARVRYVTIQGQGKSSGQPQLTQSNYFTFADTYFVVCVCDVMCRATHTSFVRRNGNTVFRFREFPVLLACYMPCNAYAIYKHKRKHIVSCSWVSCIAYIHVLVRVYASHRVEVQAGYLTHEHARANQPVCGHVPDFVRNYVLRSNENQYGPVESFFSSPRIPPGLT